MTTTQIIIDQDVVRCSACPQTWHVPAGHPVDTARADARLHFDIFHTEPEPPTDAD